MLINCKVLNSWTRATSNSTVFIYRAKAHDITTSELKIFEDGCELIIDTSLVEPMAFNRGSLYQFIGEVNVSEKITLRARIACCIDGMDMDLFNQALDIRRNYLQEDTLAISWEWLPVRAKALWEDELYRSRFSF